MVGVDVVQPLVSVFRNTTGVQSFVIRFDSESASLAIDFECREGVEIYFAFTLIVPHGL